MRDLLRLVGAPANMVCFYCPARETWPTREEAQAAAVWHVYDLHPETWLQVIGDRPPVDLRPDPRRKLS